MSTWLEAYQARLNKIVAAKTAGVSFTGDSNLSNAYALLRHFEGDTSGHHAGDLLASGSSDGHQGGFGDVGGNAKDIWNATKSGGSKVIDVLMRPNYAVANLFKGDAEAQKKSDEKWLAAGGKGIRPMADQSLSDSVGREASNAWKGLSGQEKTTFSDVLDVTRGAEETPHHNDMWKGHNIDGPLNFIGDLFTNKNAAAGLALDIALDPTTYMGFGAPLKLVRKSLGEAGELAATTKAVQASVEASKVSTNIADKVTPTVAKNIRDAPFLARDKIFSVGPDGMTIVKDAPKGIGFKPSVAAEAVDNVKNASLIASRLAVEKASKAMEAIPTRRYAEGTKIAPAFTESVGAKSAAEGVAKSAKDAASVSAKTGKSIEDIKTELIASGNHTLEVTVKGQPARVPIKKLLAMAKDKPEVAAKLDKAITAEAARLAKASTPLVAPEGASASLKAATDLIQAGPSAGAQVAAQTPSVARFKALDPAARKAWVAAHSNVLHPEDIATLLKTKIKPDDASAWHSAVADVLAKVTPTAYDDPAKLLEAMDKGLIHGDHLKELMAATGAKTPAGLKRSLARLFSNSAKLESEAAAKRTAEVDPKLWDTPVGKASEPIPVKTAEDIVTKSIKDGDTSDLEGIKAALDSSQLQDLKAALSHLVQREIIDPMTLKKYGFVSKTGTKRTAGKLNEGLGRNLNEWSKWSQFSIVNFLIKFRTAQIAKQVAEAGLKSTPALMARSDAMFEHVMPVLRTVDRLLRENGIPSMLVNNPKHAISLTDVLDNVPASFAKKHFFNMVRGNEHIPPTFWNDAADVVMDHADGLITYEKALEGVRDTLLSTNKLRSGKFISTGVKSKFIKLGGTGSKVAEDYVNDTAKTFVDAAPRLTQKSENNLAEVVLHDTENAAKISEETYKAFVELISSPGFSSHDLLTVALDRNTITESIAKSLHVISEKAKRLAKTDIEVKTAGLIPPEVAANAHHARAVGKALTDGKPVVSPVGKALADTEVAVKQIEDVEGELLKTYGEQAERTLGYHLLKNFAPHLGNKDVRHIFLGEHSFSQTIARSYSRLLEGIMKVHPKENIDAAFKELQNGTKATGDVGAAQSELEKAVKALFSDDGVISTITSAGITPGQLNSHFKKFGIHEKYAFTDVESLNHGWKSWEVLDPIDLLSKMQAAIAASAMERNIGADLTRRFSVPSGTAGSVKIKEGHSILAKYIDTTAHYPRELAEQFSVLDDAIKQLALPSKSDKVLRHYDAVLRMFKAGFTIYRPGHHIRNRIGDTWFSWMDGVNSVGPYRRALMVMRDNGGRYNDFDALKALSSMGITNAKTNGIISHTIVNGKKVSLTTGEVYRLAYKRGLLPDYKILEDINYGKVLEDTNGGKLSTLKFPKLLGGYGHKVATTVSESGEHFNRLSHFIDRLEKSSGKSLDEIADEAAKRVRKWHPDGSDVTHFESKGAKRLFLFYTWIRKAVPLVMESMYYKPGKFLIVPKSSFAMAQAMGLNPSSPSDPFPSDQQYPSWIRDDITGPQFELGGNAWSMNSGIPGVDVLNDYVRGPRNFLRTLAGGTTPAIKLPYEYLAADPTKGQVAVDSRTRVPQKDASDYIDSQLPGISSIASIFNRSPSSGFTQRTGEHAGLTAKQQSNLDIKNGSGPDYTALINWFTGLGLKNISTPGIKTSAQIEQSRARK